MTAASRGRADHSSGGRAGRAGTWARSPRGVFWLSLLAFLAVTTGWVVGNPLIASVDEASHATKAAATSRGQLFLDMEGQPAGHGVAEVPNLFDEAIDLQYCIAFQPDTPASCQPGLDGDLAEVEEVVTSAAGYNPLYYAVVGLPSLVAVGDHTLYLMRFVSALIASALFAVAMRAVAEVPRAHWLAYGLLAAVTPMVVYLSSAVNPQTTEVMGAVALWVCLLTTLHHPDPALARRRMARIAVVALVFVNSRGMSPLFLLLIVAAVLLASPWRSVVEVLRTRSAWPWIAVTGVGSVAAVLWTLLVEDSLPTVDRVINPDLVGVTIVKTTLGETSYYLQNMLGIFGWLDTPLPGWLYGVLAGAIGVVVLLGFAVAGRGVRLAMVGTGLVVLVLPVAVHWFQARYLGIIWQGRYVLPLAVGLPILAGVALRRRADLLPQAFDQRVLRLGAATFASAQVVAFGVNLHRYVNGASGDWTAPEPGVAWLPPVNPYVLLVAYGVAWAAVAVLAVRAAETTPGATTAGTAPVDGPAQPVATAER